MSNASPSHSKWRLDWPTSSGRRVAHARLKRSPEDFCVYEDLKLDGMVTGLSAGQVPGEGEHLLVHIEKTGDNTEYVARELAKLSGCRHLDVGFSGLKDRHAITRQWFSLYRPGQQANDSDVLALISQQWKVVEACRYHRKLRRGDHQCNHFVITLRDMDGVKSDIEQALASLRERGAPNYFGPQRFGIDGGNLDRAAVMDPSALDQRRRGKGRGRGKRSGGRDSKNVLYFSAARSWIFNEVLARRVEEGSWLEPLSGETGLPDQPGVVTGPLWGDGGSGASGEQAQLEQAVADQAPELLKVFSTTRMQPERRALSTIPAELSWKWLSNDSLELRFNLLPGQYATTILNDIFEIEDMSLGHHNKQQG